MCQRSGQKYSHFQLPKTINDTLVLVADHTVRKQALLCS